MADGGIVKIVKELEKDVIDFVEEEVHEFEDGDDKSSKYSEKFQGDVLGKHDPYGEDDGDHEAHESESSIPDPEHGSEWFPAVSGIKSSKSDLKKVVAKTASTGEVDPKKQGATNKEDGTQEVGQEATSASEVKSGDAAEEIVGKVNVGAVRQNTKGERDDLTTSKASNAGLGDDETPHNSKEKKTSEGDDLSTGDASAGVEGAENFGIVKGRKREDARLDASASTDGEGDSDSTASSEHEQDAKSSATESSAADTESLEDVSKSADPASLSPDSPQAIERETFRKKAPILVADLREVSRKGKKAKEQKEILRGIRRTLEKPHKLYKDPKRLIAARSGDPQKLKLSLKRHGRSVEPIDDSDPRDISVNPAKLKAVRSNHRLAMRHMIDMGEQYGKDPFDGIDPGDVQAVIEHHAAKHPHRKHKVPYRPHESLDNEGDSSDVSTVDENLDNADLAGESADPDDDGSVDVGDEESDDTDEISEDYPKLTESQNLDVDDEEGSIRRLKVRKKKRKYPKPYRDDDNPSDLQLAADSLSAMAADTADDGSLEEDAPTHKKRAHAAKKMLRCVNRVRSFQQDPAACEGAFVDEAVEDGVDVAGLSPDEIESRYYTLKQVAVHYEKRKKKKHHKDRKTPDGDELDGDDPEFQSYKKKHHNKKYQDRYIDREDDYEVDDDDYEDDDIEMSLPENQFPDSSVYSQSNTGMGTDDEPDTSSDDSGDDDKDNDNIFDEIGDTISSIFGDDEEGAEEAVSDVEGAVEGVEGAVGEAEQAAEGVETAVGEAEQAVEGVEGAVQGAEEAVSDVEGAVGEAEQAAEGVETAVGEISQVEGELSQVETIGAEAETAAEDIEEAENAEGEVAGMLNFCSNPVDKLTNGSNVLAGVGDLADNPDDIINKAEGLIEGGQDAVGGMANGSSSGDILGSIMGIVGQITGGDDSDSDDSTQDGSSDDDSGGGGLIDGIVGMIGQFTGGGGNPAPSTETTDSTAQAASIEGGAGDATPEEFANADLYGDEYN
jgi:hypothetical protein